MQVKRCNSIANALELRLSCPNTLIWFFKTVQTVKNINIYQLPLLVVNKIFVITFFVHGCPQIIIEQWRDWLISWIPVWLFTSALSLVVGNAQITCTIVISQHFNGGDVVMTLELAFFFFQTFQLAFACNINDFQPDRSYWWHSARLWYHSLPLSHFMIYAPVNWILIGFNNGSQLFGMLLSRLTVRYHHQKDPIDRYSMSQNWYVLNQENAIEI